MKKLRFISRKILQFCIFISSRNNASSSYDALDLQEIIINDRLLMLICFF